MAQNATFSLADSQATPVNYVFRPTRCENGVQFYVGDRGHASIASAYASNPSVRPTLSVSLREGVVGNLLTRQGRVKRKTVFKLVIPDVYTGTTSNYDGAFDTAEVTVSIAAPLDITPRALTDLVKMIGLMVQQTPLREVVDGDMPF